MTAEPREPSRIPVRGAIATVGTAGALTLLLSFQGGPLASDGATTAADDEASAADEPIAADSATESAAAGPTIEPEAAAEGPVEELVAEADVEPVDDDELRTATGDPIAIRWGDVQVVVTVEGDDIVDVVTIAIPMDDRRSQRINSNAEPVLREEAIATDSADVSVVSGATYTSEAYATSLQSALDQLGS